MGGVCACKFCGKWKWRKSFLKRLSSVCQKMLVLVPTFWEEFRSLIESGILGVEEDMLLLTDAEPTEERNWRERWTSDQRAGLRGVMTRHFAQCRLDKNLGRLCEDREETMGGAASHFLAPSHTASIRETIKIPWNTHTERDQLLVFRSQVWSQFDVMTGGRRQL